MSVSLLSMAIRYEQDVVAVRQKARQVAVAVDNGLIVPVIANADQLSISGVNARIRDIGSRAQAGKLRVVEVISSPDREVKADTGGAAAGLNSSFGA